MPDKHQLDLESLLACPDCGSDMVKVRDEMKCAGCKNVFEIRDGIPILFPADFDNSHLREEETLAEMMKIPEISAKERFYLGQWRQSKKEFWSVVAQNIGPAPKIMVNIGCGRDDSFRQFQDLGHFIVNFDIVYEMLDSLKLEYGARYCVAGDVKSLPFRKGTCDYLICIDLIHHESERLQQLLKRFRELLKPSGALFLEDANAWGMFQFPKSVLMPRSVHRSLRSFYHNSFKHSEQRPADYEFPTNPFKVRRILEQVGFSKIVFFDNHAYPNCHERAYKFYEFFGSSERIAKFHNYHYMLMARPGE